MHTKKKLSNLLGSILATFCIFALSSHQPCQGFSQKEVLFEPFFKSWMNFQLPVQISVWKMPLFESNIPTKESLKSLHLIGWFKSLIVLQPIKIH